LTKAAFFALVSARKSQSLNFVLEFVTGLDDAVETVMLLLLPRLNILPNLERVIILEFAEDLVKETGTQVQRRPKVLVLLVTDGLVLVRMVLLLRLLT